MADRRIDMRIVCPFYDGAYGVVIRCAPINQAKYTISKFADKAERDAYVNDFCSCQCWRGCPVAQGCEKKYDEEEGA